MRRYGLMMLAGLVFAVTIVFALECIGGRASSKSMPDSIGVSSFGDRVMIIAPHPDDEGLACAGLIQQCLHKKKEVRVVIVTAGDGSMSATRAFAKKPNPDFHDFRAVGALRCDETRSAMKELGLPASDLIFLGYPDGGVNSMWDRDWDYNHLHHGRNGADHSPYSFAYQKNAAYCGQNLVLNLESIIKEFNPDAIVYPSQLDSQHDHWAVNAFTQYALIDMNRKEKQYTYLVHRKYFPNASAYDSQDHLYPPAALLDLGTIWKSLDLSNRQESLKERSLRAYAISKSIRGADFNKFVRKNELFGTTRPIVVRRRKKPVVRFSNVNMPYVVARNPIENKMFGFLGSNGGGIKEASLCVGDQTSYLGLETVDDISGETHYIFHLRMFGTSRIDRTDVIVENGKASSVQMARNSLIPVKIALVHPGGIHTRLWIEIPSSIFKNKRDCMFSVEEVKGAHQVDKTAWQWVRIN